jgi:hypothetical protein
MHRNQNHSPAPRRAGVLAVAAGLVLLTAACGGSPSAAGSGGSSAGSGGSSQAGGSPQTGQLAFARCMRSHGVTDFPDSGALGNASPSGDLDPNNPTYRAARQACQSLWPHVNPDPAQAAQALSDGLKLSRCMRSHGITNFPDPSPHGGPGGHGGFDLRGLGIDLNSPQFQAAQQACQHYLGPNGKG